MIACTLSNLELRSIIESAFLPKRCHCSVVDGTLSVEVLDPATERVELSVTGIRLDKLDTSRALCELIAQLRWNLNDSRQLPSYARVG